MIDVITGTGLSAPGAGCARPEYGTKQSLIECAVGSVKGGQAVALTFPIPELTDRAIVEKRPYTRICSGNEVVWIEPPGRNCPLYQRGHNRQGETLWKNVRHFVPAQEIP